MVRETVLGEAGAVAMLGRDSVVGGAALANGIASADAVVPFPGNSRALETTSCDCYFTVKAHHARLLEAPR